MKQVVHIAVVIMVKNESKRLHVTLDSITPLASSLVVFDTGSTDNTIDILDKFTKKSKIPLRIMRGEFIDFSTSRNLLLDFADTFMDIDYLLLMDCNDELKNPAGLKQFAYDHINQPHHAWLMSQEWLAGTLTKYVNVRFIKPRKGWRYKGVVHEFIYNAVITPDFYVNEKINSNIYLFQDRTRDDDKSWKRFQTDYELLMTEYEKDATNDRTIFYLAQTCACLVREEESYKYYSIRANMEGGFAEERFDALLRCGNIASKYAPEIPDKNKMWFAEMTWDVALCWYMKAMTVFHRIEPLIAMTKYYRNIKQMGLAYAFIKLACMMEYPAHSLLWIDNHQFDYERWHLMGIVAFYVNQHEDGYSACQKAIKFANQDLDKSNLEFYIKALKRKK